MNKFTTIFLVTFALLAPQLSHADRHDRHEKWMDEMKLTAEQKQKIKEFREAGEADRKKAQDELRGIRKKMEEAMKGSATDAELKKLFGETQAVHQKMGAARFETMLKVRAILTPDQRKNMKMHPEGGWKKWFKGNRRGASGEDEEL